MGRGSGAGWASGRGWRSLGEAWAAVPGDGCSATAVAMHARSGREDIMNRRGCGLSVKFVYVRWLPSLCPTAYLPTVGHKFMSDGPSASPRMSDIMSDGCQ
jgi:hypothetical protein